MHPEDKNHLIESYNARVRRFGVSIRALSSGTEERREIRFKVLTEVGLAPGDTVLDLGCGFGDFYLYCQRNSLDIRYTGIDINPLLIEKARERTPGINVAVKDIQTDAIDPHDFVVSSSCFNLALKHGDNYTYIEDILRRCYAIARKGVAVEFLSDYVDYRTDEEVFHYSPERVFSIAKKITKRVCLRHDYPLFDFCVYLFPDFKGWGNPGGGRNEAPRP